MAETATFQDVKPEITKSTPNKRKRGAADDGGLRPRPGSSSNTGLADASNNEAAAFLADQNTSSAGEDGNQHAGVGAGALDFSQLEQGGTTDPSLQPGSIDNPTASDTAAAALSHYSMQVPQATEVTFQTQSSPNAGGSDRQMLEDPNARREFDYDQLKVAMGGVEQPDDSPTSANATPNSKPPVGSEEWHKVRRDNHKEVERRRRETINEGINELAKIVPGCEKNKGAILQTAVRFIAELKENERTNIEKWTLEKLLTEQAIAELSAKCEKFKVEMERAWEEVDAYKKACAEAGIEVPSQANTGTQDDE